MKIIPAAYSLVAVLLLCLGPATYVTGREQKAGVQPPIRHVFIIVLENQSFRDTFGSGSPAPYLARKLPARGALLKNYYGIGHFSLDNYIALISGQAPNSATQQDCHQAIEFQPARAGLDSHGQLEGYGCVYPQIVKTLPDQLARSGLTWKAYMEDLGVDPARDRDAACTTRRIGREDPTERAAGDDEYASKHDPFVYFHTILDNEAYCASHVVGLNELRRDLGNSATTANFSFITPNLCHDGHDPRCDNGMPGGLEGINGFLERWVPLIVRSPAFRSDGLLVITFDESNGAPPDGSDACCREQPLPGGPPPGVRGRGGGRIGAVLLSPFIRPGTVSMVPYNHYALLRTIEDIFGLSHLGYAAEPGLRTFGTDVYSPR